MILPKIILSNLSLLMLVFFYYYYIISTRKRCTLYIALTILLIVLSIFCHEYGHLWAMHKYGIKVKKMGIGLPLSFLTLKIQHPKICFGVPLYLSPLVLLGYVQPEDEEYLAQLNTEKQLHIDGMGILMNIIFSACMSILASRNITTSVLSAIIAIVVLVFNKEICKYILPVLSLSTIVFVPIIFVNTVRLVPDAGHSTSVQVSSVFALITGYQEALLMASLISIGLAAINILPLVPLDGGKIISIVGRIWLSERVVKTYEVLTILIMIIITLVSIYDTGLAALRGIIKTIWP